MKPSGNTFIVSGGSSGLGLATVQELHKAGAYVSILDLNAEAGAKVVKELGSRAKFFECDVSSTPSVEAAVNGSVEWMKETGSPLAGCIPAAGVGGAAKIYDARSESPVPISQIDFVLGINLRGTLDLVRLCVPHMVKNKMPFTEDGERGVIVMVSSSAAYDGQPGQVAYSASKGAIRSLTLPMARDLARHGIRVVTIAPALFDSAMTRVLPERAYKSLQRVMEFPVRPGKPEEFASLCLQSIENSMLNGVTIRIDGGMRMPSKM